MFDMLPTEDPLSRVIWLRLGEPLPSRSFQSWALYPAMSQPRFASCENTLGIPT